VRELADGDGVVENGGPCVDVLHLHLFG
jgi:hypothetical protein